QLGRTDVPYRQLVMAADDELLAVGSEAQRIDDGWVGVFLWGRGWLPTEPKFLDKIGLWIDPGIELGPLVDPLLYNLGFGLGEGGQVVFSRRHSPFFFGDDQSVEFAVDMLARGDPLAASATREQLLVAGHVKLARALLGVVAREAVLLQDWSDFADKAHRFVLRAGGRKAQDEPRGNRRQQCAENTDSIAGQAHGKWPQDEGRAGGICLVYGPGARTRNRKPARGRFFVWRRKPSLSKIASTQPAPSMGTLAE